MTCYVINKESVAPVIARFIIAHLLNEGIYLTMNSLEIYCPIWFSRRRQNIHNFSRGKCINVFFILLQLS